MIYVFLADGFEETEAIAPIDIIRRAEKDVITVGIGSDTVRSSHGITMLADITDMQVQLDDRLEMIVLPGGMPGTLNLEKSPVVQAAIDYCVDKNIPIAAICAAPSILGKKGLLKGKKAICFPGFEGFLDGAEISSESVVTDGNITTGVGPGASIDFGLRLVEILVNDKKAAKVAAGMQCRK
ncbi:MAG: DJ-1/PfpI family protein [Oscillospiraceae bacterium]|nr:DJ-1/PfpI family protein [Oscillospiraceae bacterium]